MSFFSMLGDIFARARQGKPLTAAERGFRDACVRWLVYQLFTLLVMVGQEMLALVGRWDFQWSAVLFTLGASTLYAIFGGLYHWASSVGDKPMALALGVISSLAKQYLSGGAGAFLNALNHTDASTLFLQMLQGIAQLPPNAIQDAIQATPLTPDIIASSVARGSGIAQQAISTDTGSVAAISSSSAAGS